jgi:membrane protease YdiL (CAAX protease family)
MENSSFQIERKGGKNVLVTILGLAFVVVVLFWVVVQLFQLEALPLYFTQLGLYLVLYLLAWWGLKQEQIKLPVNVRLILKALAWSLVSWLVFLLIIQLLGIVRLSEEFQALNNTSAWRIGAQILSTWIFVGIGEEVLFRGYILKAFLTHFTHGTDRRRMAVAILSVSAIFALWHLPGRIIWLITGEIDLVLFLISLLVLFVLGIGYAYLFIRSENILLTGLVHGLSDFPLIGKDSQLTPIILIAAIGCVEITRLITRRKEESRSYEASKA